MQILQSQQKFKNKNSMTANYKLNTHNPHKSTFYGKELISN